jgi:hypothetical protein
MNVPNNTLRATPSRKVVAACVIAAPTNGIAAV